MESTNEMLKAALEKDERILWQGKAEQFETLDNTHRKSFTIKAVVGGLIALVVSVLYVLASKGIGIKPFVFVLVFLLCGIPAFNVLGDASKLRKIAYYATDRRLITLRDSVRAMNYVSIHEAGFRMDRDGHLSLLCGEEALKLNPEKWRETAIVGQGATEGPECVRFVFYAPTDSEALKAVLNKHLSFPIGETRQP